MEEVEYKMIECLYWNNKEKKQENKQTITKEKDIPRKKSPNRASKRVSSKRRSPTKLDKMPSSSKNILICDDTSCLYKRNKSPESNRESALKRRLSPIQKYPYRNSYDSRQKDSFHEKQSYDSKILCPYFKQNYPYGDKKCAHFKEQLPFPSKFIYYKENYDAHKYNYINNHIPIEEKRCPYFKENCPSNENRCPYFREKCSIVENNSSYKGKHFYKKERMELSNRPSPDKNQGEYKLYEDCNPEHKYSYVENIYSYDDSQDNVCQQPEGSSENTLYQDQHPYTKTEEPHTKNHASYPENDDNRCRYNEKCCDCQEKNQLLNEKCFCKNYRKPCCCPRDPCQPNLYQYLCGPYFTCARYLNCCCGLCTNVNQTLLNVMCFKYFLCRCGNFCRPNPFYYYYYMSSFAHVAAIAVASGIFWFLFGANIAMPYIRAVSNAFTNQFPTEFGGMSLPPASTPFPALEIRRRVREPRMVKFCFKQYDLLNVVGKNAGVVNVVMSPLWIEVIFVVFDML